MEKKRFYMLNIVTFASLLFFFFGANLIYPAPEVLKSERRSTAKFPDFFTSANGLIKINQKFSKEFETYALDHVAFREPLRRIKAYSLYYVFGQTDNNGIYIVDEHAAKIETLRGDSVRSGADKMNRIQQNMLTNQNVYYAVIPDKGYYLAEKRGCPSIDYQQVEQILNEKLTDMEYISLLSALSAESYYKTDLHWKQEKLWPIVHELSGKMSFSYPDDVRFDEVSCSPFYGVYYGQSALPLPSETLKYLTGRGIEKTKVTYLDEKTFEMKEGVMYDEALFYGIDPYDIFLKGAKPLVVLENETATSDKELYIFRDSFACSLAPLLTTSYKKITLIDLRYLASPYVEELIEFQEGADVLFLYSMQVLNDSALLLVK